MRRQAPALMPQTDGPGLPHMVVPAAWVAKVDDWRRREPDLPNLSEAIRRLVDIGLESARGRRR